MLFSRFGRLIVTAFFVLITSLSSYGQNLSAFAGVGLGYDAFLRDPAITKYKSGWPLQLGVQSAFGIRLHTEQAFDVIADATLGITTIAFPGIGDTKSNEYLEQVQSLIMVGSGLHLPIDDHGSSVMPYVQIGAGFFDFWGVSSDGSTSYSGTFVTDMKTNRWIAVCGAGLDWQFKLFIPASFNLRCVYTPLDIFSEPIKYYQPTAKGQEELYLQGKLLQTIFTFRVYLPVHNWSKEN